MPDKSDAPAKQKTAAAPRKTRKPRAAAPAPAESAAPQETTVAPAAQDKPKKAPTRTRTARPKKPSKPAAAPAPEPVSELATTPAPAPAPAPELDVIPEPGPAPEPAPGFAAPETVGGHEPQGNGGHRKRRRRNRRGGGGDNAQQQAPARLPHVDADELKRRAWKIYLGEVTEEGLALMDDRTAAEAARRAFRVAEQFLIEAAHHRPLPPQQPAPEPTPGEQA